MMRRVVSETESALVIIDHTGHAVPFVQREGTAAARGAASKGQKADSFLRFKAKGERLFEIVHANGRVGGQKAPAATWKVVDTDDDGLAIVPGSLGDDSKIRETAEAIVEAIGTAGMLTSKDIREVVKGQDQKVTDAMKFLRYDEKPRRVRVRDKEPVQRPDRNGRTVTRKVTAWRLAYSEDEAMLDLGDAP